jgi:hypothetical protein
VASSREIMMRQLSFVLFASAAVVLASCDRQPSVDLTNASPAEVAKAMKDSGATRSMVRPGKWSSTVSILEMDTSQLPPEMAQKIRGDLAKPRTIQACLTAEEVDHPERMLAQVPPSCRYDYYRMQSGRIDGKMRCDGPGGKQEMTVQGTYATDRYSMTIGTRAAVVPGAPVGSGNSKMKIDSHRLGECDGKEQI